MRLLMVGEVAERAGVGRSAVLLWHRQGKLPALLSGKGWRLFREEDVTRFLARRERMKLARQMRRVRGADR